MTNDKTWVRPCEATARAPNFNRISPVLLQRGAAVGTDGRRKAAPQWRNAFKKFTLNGNDFYKKQKKSTSFVEVTVRFWTNIFRKIVMIGGPSTVRPEVLKIRWWIVIWKCKKCGSKRKKERERISATVRPRRRGGSIRYLDRVIGYNIDASSAHSIFNDAASF
jgi:hypothetical protein